MTILALIFTDSYLESSVDSGFFLFCRIGLLVCVFAIYYVLLQSLEGLEQQAALRQRLVFESACWRCKWRRRKSAACS